MPLTCALQSMQPVKQPRLTSYTDTCSTQSRHLRAQGGVRVGTWPSPCPTATALHVWLATASTHSAADTGPTPLLNTRCGGTRHGVDRGEAGVQEEEEEEGS